MSLRQFLNSTETSTRSRSPDIGYQRLAYGNGRYVAVGYQLGYPPSLSNPNAGVPVTAAGCSWSDDGVRWTDSKLPFFGTSTVYESVAFNGTRWQAISCQRIGTAGVSNYVCSDDNAVTWNADPAGRETSKVLRTNFAIGNQFFAAGNLQDAQSTVMHERGTGFRTGAARRNEVAGSIGFTAGCARNATQGLILNGWASLVYNGTYTAYPAEWGNAAAGTNAGQFNPASVIYTPIAGYTALVSDTNLAQANAAGAWRYRAIWNSPGGANWTRSALLPFVAGEKGPYYQLAYGSGLLVACGYGLLCVSSNAINWREARIPAGKWTGIASDGTDFVTVSAEGERMRISGAYLQNVMSR